MIKHRSTDAYQSLAAKKSALITHQSLIANNKKQEKSILDDFCRENLSYAFTESQLIVEGTYVYQLPQLSENYPNLAGLKVIHPGWWLGSISKRRFTPSHSLAMGISGDFAMRILPLRVDDRRLSAYLAGESFGDLGDNGWVLVSVDGFPVGWGKRVQNVIKNFYPHGLRRFA
jgi:NOL1/NOP2/fmu family ribosome biogenesis protein